MKIKDAGHLTSVFSSHYIIIIIIIIIKYYSWVLSLCKSQLFILLYITVDEWHDQKIDVFSQVQECRSNK